MNIPALSGEAAALCPPPDQPTGEPAQDHHPHKSLVQCPVCVLQFPEAIIHRHVNSCLDTARPTVQCPICDHSLPSPEALDRHIAAFHDVHPFECPICFEGKGGRALALCCRQELCGECARQPLRSCPFCRASVWRWKVPKSEPDDEEEGCSCLRLLFYFCGLGYLIQCLLRRRKH